MSKRSLPALLPLAALSLTSLLLPVRSSFADGDGATPPASARAITLAGTIWRVDLSRNLLTIRDENSAPHVVDMNAAFVFLDSDHSGTLADLHRGMQVEIKGVPTWEDRLDGRSVRLISSRAVRTRIMGPGSDVMLTGIVSASDTGQATATVVNAYGRRFTVDYMAADLATRSVSYQNSALALARGQRILVRGTAVSDSLVVADRVSILSEGASDANVVAVAPATPPAFHVREDTPIRNNPAAISTAPPDVATLPAAPTSTPAPTIAYNGTVPPSPDPATVMASLDTYTGLLIDARHLTKIGRSPAPNIFGPAPGNNLLYPDRAHVPTPDQVQDESIVRYYHTEAEAEAGEVGAHPLILPAQALRGPADDSVELSAQDMELLLALDNKLHFTQNWKVGFLIPGNE